MAEFSIDSDQAKTRGALRTNIAPAPGATLSSQEQNAITLGQKIAEIRVNQEQGSARPEMLSDSEASKKIKDLFVGKERDAAGRLTDARLRRAEREMTTSDTMVRKLATEGYDSLNATEQQIVIRKLDTGLDRLPGLTNLPAKGTPERDAAIEAWLRDPANKEYFTELIKLESEVLDKGIGSREDVDAAKEEISEAEKTRDDLIVRLGEQQEIVQAIDTEIADFDADPNKGQQINTLIGQLDTAQLAYDTRSAQLELDEVSLQNLSTRRSAVHSDKVLSAAQKTTELAAIDANEKALKRRMDTAIGEQAAAKIIIDRTKLQIESLQKEREDMNNAREGAEAQWKNLLEEFRVNGRRLDIAYDSLYTATGGLDVLPDKITASLETAFVSLIEKRISADNEVFRQQLEDMEKEANDGNTKQLLKGIRERYYKRTRARSITGGHESLKLDKKIITEDWGAFLNTGQPNELIRRALQASGMPPADIAARLADAAFVKEATPIIMEQLIALRIRSGNKMSEDEASYISSFDWAEGVFDKALAKNKQVQEMLGKLQAEGIIEDKTLSAIRRADKKTILQILLALFGSAAIGAGLLGIGGVAAFTAGGVSIGGSIASR